MRTRVRNPALLLWTLATLLLAAGRASTVNANIIDDIATGDRGVPPKVDIPSKLLPQGQTEIDWRRKRIESSLKQLDELLRSPESGEHAVSRNESVQGHLMSRSEMNANMFTSSSATTSFLETGSKTQFAGAVAGAALNMFFSRTTMCVMCSYILEMADRQVKASPRWANGGGGFFPGQVDFSPGENQGFFRTYPGGYLEMEERARSKQSFPIGSGKPEPPRRSRRQRDPEAMPMRMQSTGVQTSQRMPPAIDTSPGPITNYARAQNMYGMGTNEKAPVEQAGKKMRVGRFTPRDFDRVDAQAEKSMEYQQMFKDLMDAFDEICFSDLPASYSQYCNLIFHNGEALVEFYLHDYEDWEICTKIFTCIAGFYDDI
eukprot:g1661.t1